MKKNIVKLNESALRKIVAERVKKVLREYGYKNGLSKNKVYSAEDAAANGYEPLYGNDEYTDWWGRRKTPLRAEQYFNDENDPNSFFAEIVFGIINRSPELGEHGYPILVRKDENGRKYYEILLDMVKDFRKDFVKRIKPQYR